MNKRFLITSVIIVFLSSLALYAAKQNITIQKTGKTKGAVTFNHEQHKKTALAEKKNCKSCHHIGKMNQACASAGCHVDANLDRGGKRIHKTCLTACHRQAKFKDKAPTKCNDKRCHN